MTSVDVATAGQSDESVEVVDVVVVGAGMAGLYMLYRLRELGFSAIGLETGHDVGGTWYWNRYPGARCDIQSIDYSYSFDPDLDSEWTWSEKYATQPEILRYLGQVADKHDLRGSIRFETRVGGAVWHDDEGRWHLTTSGPGGSGQIACTFYVMATGCLSVPKTPDIAGFERYTGEVYFTGRWPHEGVDFTGKRVAVVGTGSSGIQSIPLIAQQAQQLTVFQRTPNFSIPAGNGPIPDKKLNAVAEVGRDEYRRAAKWPRGGVPGDPTLLTTFGVSEEERQQRYEEAWEAGELSILGVFADVLVNPAANEALCEFVREKIRSIVDDPQTADDLCPKDHYFGTKRPCLDTGYFATFNLPHVRLVNLRKTPIVEITETGIDTTDESLTFDAIVFATGFDAMTGPLVAVDITGRDGLTLQEAWEHGPVTYLGLTTVGFPNLFAITGPGSPSVLSNMVVSIEQHVDWIADCLDDLRRDGFDRIEPTGTAQSGWVQHVNDCADITLYPRANSWYMGANVPGKPRVFLPYIGGVDSYRRICDEVAEQGYLGFALGGNGSAQCNDGIIRRLQPDVQMILEAVAAMGLPALESMSSDDARAFSQASSAMRPPGPDVGEIVDGTFPSADGSPLEYRLYRPDTPGPHAAVVYFHGGGWVLGSADSDDPLCRDLCVRTGAVIVSMNYRHAPEARFPAAADDALAALRWVADHTGDLGISGPIALSGWSAGGNLALVTSQRVRDEGGPDIAGMVVLTPVTDGTLATASYSENAEGYILTSALMHWFYDYYVDEADRLDPRVAPIRGRLDGLPPTVVVAAEFDPLRDEGAAYVEAVQAAGGHATLVPARGHTHTSITMVDMVLSGAAMREAMADALRRQLDSSG